MKQIKHAAIELNRASVFIEEKQILNAISLSIKNNEHVAILGPNGSGKSTLIKMLSGDIYPVYNDDPPPIKLFGETEWNLFELRNKLGIVTNELQEKHLKPISGNDVVLSGFFGSIGLYPYQKVTGIMKNKVKKVLAILEIGHLKDRQIIEMSSGEARRFLIARALVHDPEILVLDEPFNSLDVKTRLSFGKVIRKLSQKGHSLILVTHALEEILPEIDRVIMIKKGRLYADGSKQKLLTTKVISGLYDCSLKVLKEQQHYWVKVKL